MAVIRKMIDVENDKFTDQNEEAKTVIRKEGIIFEYKSNKNILAKEHVVDQLRERNNPECHSSPLIRVIRCYPESKTSVRRE